MAGIGFELRKLTQRGDLLGIAQAYGHSAIATAGPWILTAFALGAIVLAGNASTSPEELATFRLIVIYNFAASLVMAGPVSILITRYLADSIFEKRVDQVPAALVCSLGVVWGLGLLFSVPMWFLWLRADAFTRICAFLNYNLIAGIWLVSVFLTALKNYRAITAAFACGMLASIVAAALLASGYPIAGMLLGFDLGLSLILILLLARVFAEYPTPAVFGWEWLSYCTRYWELAAGAVAYNLGIWIDKVVMWRSPHAETLTSGLTSCPMYESATFLSYLTILPAMAAFTVIIETGFFERYVKFYNDIRQHAALGRIRSNQQGLIEVFLDGGRNFLVLQGSICATAVLLAPSLFDAGRFGQLGTFRLATVGALFHAASLFLNIVLAYFDLRRETLWLQTLFLVSNGLFTWIAMEAGFRFYGAGYALASIVTFVASYLVTTRHLGRLPWSTFVENNSSVRFPPAATSYVAAIPVPNK